MNGWMDTMIELVCTRGLTNTQYVCFVLTDTDMQANTHSRTKKRQHMQHNSIHARLQSL